MAIGRGAWAPRCDWRRPASCWRAAGVRSDGDDLRFAGGGLIIPADFLGEAHGFADEGFHDHGFGDSGDDFAPDEDLSLAVTRGDTQVSLAGLTGAVYDAAHHRD